jgi:hypothetical protein
MTGHMPTQVTAISSTLPSLLVPKTYGRYCAC